MQTNQLRQQHSYLLYFLFFLNMWCLGSTYSYVPVRTFTPSGTMVDILDIEQSLHLSPWVIYFFVGYLVAYMFWQFFTNTLIKTYQYAGISSLLARAGLMTFCVFVLFGYCGLTGFVKHGEVSHFISVTSLYAIPGLLIILWPNRNWVWQRLILWKHS